MALLLCEAAEWRAFDAAIEAEPLLREHVQLNVVLGAWRPWYPFNIIRYAALEPWNSAHMARLPAIRDPTCARETLRAHETGEKAAGARGGALGPDSPPAPGPPPGDTPRPWLVVIDADGILSCDEARMRALLASAAAQAGTPTDEEPSTPAGRRLYSLVTFQLRARFSDLEKAQAASEFLATDPRDASALLELARARFRRNKWELAQQIDVLTSMEGARGWFARGPDSGSRLGAFKMHAEPYFAAKPPIPYFPEVLRGRSGDKSVWWLLLAHRGEYTARVLPQAFIYMDTAFDTWAGQLLPRRALAPTMYDISGAERPATAYFYSTFGHLSYYINDTTCHGPPSASEWMGGYPAEFTPTRED